MYKRLATDLVKIFNDNVVLAGMSIIGEKFKKNVDLPSEYDDYVEE